MSGRFAAANPHRIKAAHRRRRKVAWGPIVQRYYDPEIGRFLSVDPVTANGNTGGNFNRYWYANNNPYRFTDPDGRQPQQGGGSHPLLEQIERERILRKRKREIAAAKQARNRAASDRFSGVTITYNAPAPRTVPPSGANAEALQCTLDCAGATSALVTGGAEKSGHSRNSLHYQDKAVDIPGPPYNNLQNDSMMVCAGLCGYTHGWWEEKGSPQRDHWHFQIGQGSGVPALDSAALPDWSVIYGAGMDGWRSGP